MSGPYAILEANPLLALRQQSHLPQFSFLLQFLVFLLAGQVDLCRRHLGFKYIWNSYLQVILNKNFQTENQTKEWVLALHICNTSLKCRLEKAYEHWRRTRYRVQEPRHSTRATYLSASHRSSFSPPFFKNKFLFILLQSLSEKKTSEECTEQEDWWVG